MSDRPGRVYSQEFYDAIDAQDFELACAIRDRDKAQEGRTLSPDALFEVGGTWLRLSAIDGLESTGNGYKTLVYLRGGQTLHASATVEMVCRKMHEAMSAPARTSS